MTESSNYVLRESHFVPHVPLIFAERDGLVSGVETRRTTSSDEQFSGLRDHEIDVAVTAMDNVFVWNQRGANVRIVGQVEQTTPLTFVGRPDYQQLADLEGVTFATDAATNGFALVARFLLDREGVTVKFVETGGVRERFEALVNGEVDATLLGPPFDKLAADAGFSLVTTANELLPDYPGQGIVVRATRSEPESRAIDRYLASLRRAVVRFARITEAEAIEVLEDRDFPRASAAAMWRIRPRSLDISWRGLKSVESIRSQLGQLPADYADLSDIAALAFHDGSVL